MTNDEIKQIDQISSEIRRLQAIEDSIRNRDRETYIDYIKSLVWMKDKTFCFVDETSNVYRGKYKLLFHFSEMDKPCNFYGCTVWGDEKNYDKQVRFRFEPYSEAVLECSSADVMANFIKTYKLKVKIESHFEAKARLYQELCK